jgi:hypothetical protein
VREREKDKDNGNSTIAFVLFCNYITREKEYDGESKSVNFRTENYTHQGLFFHLNKIINRREVKI